MNRKNSRLRVFRLVLAFCLLLSGFGFMSPSRANASSYVLSMDNAFILKGNPIIIAYSGSRSDKDWIGIYEAGRDPGPRTSLEWYYARNGGGELIFNKPLEIGEYKAYFFKNDGYEYETFISFTVWEMKAPAKLELSAERTDDHQLRGTAVITPPDGNDKVKSYRLYWGGSVGVLPGAPEVATITSTAYNEPVAYEIPERTVIPDGAVSLLAFSLWGGQESREYTAAKLPGYKVPEEIELTLMSLNIWQGELAKKYGIERSAKFIADLIQQTGTDVAGIQESNSEMVRKASERLGYYYIDRIGTDLSLISKYPIIEVDEEHDYYLVEVDPGRAVAVGNVHLSSDPYGPYDIADGVPVREVMNREYRFHMKEMRNAFGKLPALADQNMPVFLTGDFNVASHLDWIEATKDLHHGQVVEWPVSKKLEEAGMQDSYRVMYPDPVAAPGVTWAVEGTEWRNPESYDRIDYVYSGGPTVTLDSKVVGEKKVKGGPISPSDLELDPWLPDHRAVVSTFKVKPRTYDDLILPSVPPIEKAVLAMDRTVVEQGKSFTFSYRGAQGGRDWVGLYRKGDTPGASTPSLKWDYVSDLPDGAMTLGDSSKGTVRSMKELGPGDYYIALMLDDGYKENADRVYFRIENKKTTRLKITPEKAELQLDKENKSVQLKVEAVYNTNEMADVTSVKEISYVSSNPEVATVTAAGLVQAVSAGTAAINAVYDGQTATISVTVKADEPTPTPTALSEIAVNGTKLAGFQPGKLEYHYELPAGTEVVPSVTAVTYDPNAAMRIVEATVLPGTTYIDVTAEDKNSMATYSIYFTIAGVDVPKGNDATLTSIELDGRPIGDFERYRMKYEVDLPAGTLKAPTVTATAYDPNSHKLILPAEALPGTATIRVTSEDGAAANTYEIHFTVKEEEPKGTDATLKEIYVGGKALSRFDQHRFIYDVTLPAGTKRAPEVTAAASDSKASVRIKPAQRLPGVTEIVVTAEDGITSLTYRIHFTVQSSSPDSGGGGNPVYGVPVHNVAKQEEKQKVEERPRVDETDRGEEGKTPERHAPQATLSDIAAHWAKEAIEKAVRLGFVTGYEDGTFRPNAEVTRAEFAAMLARAMKWEGDGASLSFADRDAIPAWAGTSVAGAVKAGMIQGYDDNTFRSARNVTRAEIAAMIVRALGLKVNPDAELTFADTDRVPAWAVPYVAAAAEAGLMQGRGNNQFAPGDNAARAEAVTLILAMLESK